MESLLESFETVPESFAPAEKDRDKNDVHLVDQVGLEEPADRGDASTDSHVEVAGVSTIRQFLEADLIDQMHIVLVPIFLGRGERLWGGLEGLEQRFGIEAAPSPSGVIHLTFARRDRVV